MDESSKQEAREAIEEVDKLCYADEDLEIDEDTILEFEDLLKKKLKL